MTATATILTRHVVSLLFVSFATAFVIYCWVALKSIPANEQIIQIMRELEESLGLQELSF